MPPRATSAKPVFFTGAAEWRAWLEAHHETETELSVGFYKKHTGTPSMTWPESVDEALCFGWIDGVRHGIDAERYRIRFTPRKAKSNWSAVNLKRMPELIAEGRAAPAGVRAYEARTAARSGIYAYENRKDAVLPAAYEKRFKANRSAYRNFLARPAGYRALAIWRVISAKQEATREKRLAALIEEHAN